MSNEIISLCSVRIDTKFHSAEIDISKISVLNSTKLHFLSNYLFAHEML